MKNGEYLRFFWLSVCNNNNYKKKELFEIIFRRQQEFKNNKIAFKNLSPYEFQLSSTFSKIVRNEDEFQVVINWNKKRKVEYKFSINRLNILIDKKGIIFRDMKKQYHRKEIIILFE